MGIAIQEILYFFGELAITQPYLYFVAMAILFSIVALLKSLMGLGGKS